MHYQPGVANPAFRHDPFLALVVPRPIGWISTLSAAGVVNLAPYSFFNAVSGSPPMVMFSSSTPKDSRRNAESRGEFVANLATFDLRHAVNLTSAALLPEESEADLAGLELAPSRLIATPRVRRAPIALECRYVKTVLLQALDGSVMQSALVIGQVVSAFIDDELIVEGMVDLSRIGVLSRLGYLDYGVLGNIFSLPRP